VKALGMEATHDIIVERLVLALADHDVWAGEWQKAQVAFAGHRYLTMGEFRKVEQQLKELRIREFRLRTSIQARFRYQAWQEKRAVARAEKIGDVRKRQAERHALGKKLRGRPRIGKIALR